MMTYPSTELDGGGEENNKRSVSSRDSNGNNRNGTGSTESRNGNSGIFP